MKATYIYDSGVVAFRVVLSSFPHTFPPKMDELIERFSTLVGSESMSKIMAEAQSTMDHDMSTQSKSISAIPPDPKTGGSYLNLSDLDITDAGPAQRTEVLKSITDSIVSKPLRFPPLDTLPCANVQVYKYEVCNKPGTMVCSECRLVSYCSKVGCIFIFFGHIF